MSNTNKKTYNKPVTEVVDDQIRKGGEWKHILANINRVVTRRNYSQNYTKGRVEFHIKKRLEQDPDFYEKQVHISEKGINVEEG